MHSNHTAIFHVAFRGYFLLEPLSLTREVMTNVDFWVPCHPLIFGSHVIHGLRWQFPNTESGYQVSNSFKV